MPDKSLTELLAPLTPAPRVLPSDTGSLWQRLLGHAWRWNPPLYHFLKAAQVTGAELMAGQGKANLNQGQVPMETWARLKRFLEPHRALLVDLLRRTMMEDPADALADQPTPYDEDPSPRLCEDHERWVVLLTRAWREEDRDPFGALHTARTFGAKLLDDKDGGWRVEMGRVGYQLWDEIRRDLLMPNKDAITRLLRLASLGAEASPEEADRFEEQNRANQQRLAL